MNHCLDHIFKFLLFGNKCIDGDNLTFSSSAPKIDWKSVETGVVVNHILTNSLEKELIVLLSNDWEGWYINLLDKIVADSLLICGRVTDGIITEVDGKWKDILGYDDDQLVGHRYDRADLIHPDELKRVWRIQEKLKGTESITESRYCTIQRWKHGQTGDYVMLSMVWDVNVTENTAIVICKPIDRFIDGGGELN